jgi:hypothetical protein
MRGSDRRVDLVVQRRPEVAVAVHEHPTVLGHGVRQQVGVPRVVELLAAAVQAVVVLLEQPVGAV